MSYTSLSIAEFIVSNQFKMIWCSSILAFAIIGISRIYLATFKVKSQLKAAKKSISSIDESQTADLKINTLHQEFAKHNKLNNEWQNCKDEAITDSNQPNKIFCPNSIDHYFNEDQLDNQLIPRIVHAPNETQLTTLGVIGTFVGLASGVFLAKEGFQKNDMSELQLALSQLLSGASLAFLTAITGILCSLVFGKIRMSLLNSLQQNLLHFHQALKRHFQSFDIAKILQNQLTLQQTQQSVFSEMLKELKAQKNSKELLGEKILSQ
ncbi:hypothetical protein MEO40_26915, partial [Dolichospermum sp. ST_sed1]|nr:hypothetical protein [Dolichospermum sp. ST_sed1]